MAQLETVEFVVVWVSFELEDPGWVEAIRPLEPVFVLREMARLVYSLKTVCSGRT